MHARVARHRLAQLADRQGERRLLELPLHVPAAEITQIATSCGAAALTHTLCNPIKVFPALQPLPNLPNARQRVVVAPGNWNLSLGYIAVRVDWVARTGMLQQDVLGTDAVHLLGENGPRGRVAGEQLAHTRRRGRELG